MRAHHKYTDCLTLSGLVTVLLLIAACRMDVPDEVRHVLAEMSTADYNLDVKPILSDRCYQCHGPDEAQRKADMRLDTRAGLYARSSLGNRPFARGSLSKSAVIKRILSNDPDVMMPPPESKLALSAEEKAKLIAWVQDGAEWSEHWAYLPPTRPAVPAATDWPVHNDIDNFIQTRLREKGLAPSEPAGKEQLIRRVTFDLTGLPPTVQEIDAFLSDQRPQAYQLLVDRLLQTEAHAERMTLEWLDVARYADSHGLHADGSRHAWPWRDWVIAAFAENMPYDQFVTEQLAGDLLPNPTRDQVVATAFNRNHPMTAEGGVVDEEFRVEYVADRTNTFGTAFLGLTLECARCHDHKFDPISQREYYQVSSVFNNVRELGMTGDDGDYGPMITLEDEVTQELLTYLEEKIASSAQTLPANVDKQTHVFPVFYQSFDKVEVTDKQNYLDHNREVRIGKEVELVEGVQGRAPLFEDLYQNVFIEKQGLFDIHEPFSISVWINPRVETGKTKFIISNSGEKNAMWRGWDLHLDSTNHLAFRLISVWPGNCIDFRTVDTIAFGQWTHVMATYDGSSSAAGMHLFVNGSEVETTTYYDRLYKSIYPTNNRRTPDDRALVMGRSYRAFTGDNGVFLGSVDELAIYDFAVPPESIAEVMAMTRRGEQPDVPMDDAYLQAIRDLSVLRKEHLAVTDSVPELMVMEEMEQPRATFVLDRGMYDQPLARVKPGAIDKVAPFDNFEPNRLGLAHWLFDDANPLSARVAVNRYWHMIFGQGIVSTLNDFGSQGALPTHPELLDWLAVEFRESGWDVRKLIKMMVTSHTYRQSSVMDQPSLERDPSNAWLSRAPSYRWQAEFIRDNALAASGLLNTQVGGESTKPYQPEGLWIELGNFSHFLFNYDQDHDEKQYRRSMYTFIRRTAPPPFMSLFDGPSREICTVNRERTNTPLQALVLLNDPQFVEASRALAVRILLESSEDLDDQIEYGFRLAVGRKPNAEELRILSDLFHDQLAHFEASPAETRQFLQIGDYEMPDGLNSRRVAAMAVVSNTFLNLDESYSKR